MIDILIPVGDFPFLTQACCRNILETKGNEQANIYFLTNKKFNIDCANIVEVPVIDIDRGAHLKFLDWAVKEFALSDRFYIQHCDMFWKEAGWLDKMIANDFTAVMPTYEKYEGEFKHKKHKFRHNNQNLIRTHDFSGLYIKDEMKDYSFLWGNVKDIGSSLLMTSVLNQEIDLIHQNRKLLTTDFLDGSDRIGLELHLRGKQVKEVDVGGYYHAWDLFGMTWAMFRNGQTLYINRLYEKSLRGLATYSWITSYLIDKDKYKDLIFPWKVLKSIIKDVKKPKICALLEKYKDTDNVLGDNNNGVNLVEFNDVKFYV